MGSYAHLYLDLLEVDSSKNGIVDGFMQLFRPGDKKIDRAGDGALPASLREWTDHANAHDDFSVVYYEASLAVVRDRLDLLGYTLANVREYYDAAFDAALTKGLPLEMPASMGADAWMAGLRRFRDLRRSSANALDASSDAILSYMTRQEAGLFGFPGYDTYAALRLAAEALDPVDTLVYDLTDVAHGGWVDADADHIEIGIDELAVEHSFRSRTIVLTEGPTDSAFLKGALSVLYPHLTDYFSFMDFGGLKVAGSAGELVKLVKAFAAAGVANRVIALFDNDTAARDAIRSIPENRLPSRFAIRQLPDTELLRSYPTAGPSGRREEDVNGRAGSLELYLGCDVLRGEDGELSPVRWKGFVEGVSEYQGTLHDKRGVQERFEGKLAAADGARPSVDDPAWTELRAICKVLLTAFHEVDAELIVSRADEEW